MDPQQCLALEVTYTALENGGFTKEQMKGTNTGVYIGKLNEERYPSFYIIWRLIRFYTHFARGRDMKF